MNVNSGPHYLAKSKKGTVKKWWHGSSWVGGMSGLAAKGALLENISVKGVLARSMYVILKCRLYVASNNWFWLSLQVIEFHALGSFIKAKFRKGNRFFKGRITSNIIGLTNHVRVQFHEFWICEFTWSRNYIVYI